MALTLRFSPGLRIDLPYVPDHRRLGNRRFFGYTPITIPVSHEDSTSHFPRDSRPTATAALLDSALDGSIICCRGRTLHPLIG